MLCNATAEQQHSKRHLFVRGTPHDSTIKNAQAAGELKSKSYGSAAKRWQQDEMRKPCLRGYAMEADNPMLDYRMTFQSAMYVIKSKDAVIRAMEAINEGRPQVAYEVLHELIMLPGIEEIDSAVMTLVEGNHP